MGAALWVFATGTGTDVGKTFVSERIVRELAKTHRVAAIKPFETDVNALPKDATRLAQACKRPELATGFYRVEPALGPYAATLAGERPPNLEALADEMIERTTAAEVVWVEGAGGPLVPLNADTTIADFVASLRVRLAGRAVFSTLLVARNELGVQSHTLAAVEALAGRELGVEVLVLNAPMACSPPDQSLATNRVVLEHVLQREVVELSFEPPVEALSPVVEQLRKRIRQS